MCTQIRNLFLFLHSIEFDRDFDYFAIAGVTKKIKVFPLNSYVFRANLDSITLLGANKLMTSLWYKWFHINQT